MADRPYIPGCDHDLFISYASENDRDGWIRNWMTALKSELLQQLGKDFSERNGIFLDDTALRVGDNFPERIEVAASRSALHVPILTPGYLKSDWCTRERNAFMRQMSDPAKRSERVLPVLIRPVEANSLGPLRETHQFSFLSADGITPCAVGSPDWIERIPRFSAHVKERLQRMRRNYDPIFLGRVPTERAQQPRDPCRRALAHRCVRVVPDASTEQEDDDE